MPTQNYMAKQIASANRNNAIRLDESVKRVLALKPILARILKGSVKEFAYLPLADIEHKYIEGTPSIAKEALHEDDEVENTEAEADYEPTITGTNVEHKTKDEGTSTFDIKFTTLVPHRKQYLQFIVNVEGQGKDNALLKRGIYYCGRMLSAQYGTVFTKSHYHKLRKVVSIWICFTHNKKNANTINRYSLEEKHIAGNFCATKANYHMVDIITIYLGNDWETHNPLLKMLDKIFSEEYNTSEKQKYLEEECNIPMTETIAKEVSEMCNYSSYIKQKGKAEVVENMLRDKEPIAKIQKYTNFTVKGIKEIAAQIGVAVVM